MKKILLVLFVYAASFSKAQCVVTVSVNNICCFGSCNGSVSFILSAGCTNYPYFVSLSNAACIPTPSIVLSSSVTVFNNLCACSSSYTVFDNTASIVSAGGFSILQAPLLTISTITNVAATCGTCCNGYANVLANGGTPGYTYTWTGIGGPVAFTASLTNACPGSYTVCVKDACGCITCQTLAVGVGAGIFELQSEPVKLIYNEDKIIFENSTAINFVSVFDLTGRLIYKSERISQNNFILNKQIFNKAMYVVIIENEKQLWRQKIIID